MLPPVENWKPQKESPKACLLRRLPGRLTESYQMTPARLEAALAGPNPHSTGSLAQGDRFIPLLLASLVLCGVQPTTRVKELSAEDHPSAMMTGSWRQHLQKVPDVGHCRKVFHGYSL